MREKSWRVRAADIVRLTHVLVVVILIAGPILTGLEILQPHSMFGRAHFMFILVTVISQLLFLGCPLTILEEWLRGKSNPKDFHGSFTAYLLSRFFGIRLPVVLVGVIVNLGLGLILVVSAFYTLDPYQLPGINR